MSSDPDNIGAAMIIYFLIKSHDLTFPQAYGLIKERRISVNLIDSLKDILID